MAPTRRRKHGSSSKKSEERWAGEDPNAFPPSSTDVDPALTVVGYACDMFRDDAAASFVHAGSHLIPWMGTDSIKNDLLMDRYDARMTLDSIKLFEKNRAQYPTLSRTERKEEEDIDRERYRDLFAEPSNSDDDTTPEYTSKKGAAIGFVYDSGKNKSKGGNVISTKPVGPPFVCPIETLPAHIKKPSTWQEHALILHTARRVAGSPQLEILLKVQ